MESAINLALRARCFSDIILTTDIPELITQYAHDTTVRLRARPELLCTDTATMWSVVEDAIQCFNLSPDYWVWLLQPTSPFRTVQDIKTIYSILTSLDVNSVISFQEVGQFHPDRMYELRKNRASKLKHTNFDNKQDLLPLYIRNGAFYVTRVRNLLDSHSFYVTECYGYVMPPERSINIDNKYDLAIAKIFSKSEGAL